MSGFTIGKLGLGAAGATAIVVLIAGCAASSSSGTPAAGAGSNTSQSQPAVSGSASGMKTMSTSIGKVLVDASGRTLYELVGDSAAKQTCTGGCVAIWPPVQANGSQVIVNGHPAFTFTGDSAAGQTKGHNVKDQWGLWLALDASGNPVGAPGAKTTAPGGGGVAF
jgi:predicted lipoprotein with Yx(FWY)xxD motif